MVKFTRKRLGDLLVEAEAVTETQLMEALSLQKKSNKRLGQVLIENGYITEERLIEILEEQLGIPHIDLYNYEIDPQVATSIPKHLAQRYQVIPVEKRNNKLVLAMSDPMNIIAMEDVSMATAMDVEPVIASEGAVNHAIAQFYGLMESLVKTEEQMEQQKAEDEEVGRLKALVEEAPIVKVVNSMIHKAAAEGASDIHIEPTETGLRVRMRVDGILFDYMQPPKDTQFLIISRIKIMSNMDIAERRLPQDGQISMDLGMKKLNIRVSTLPTVHGEKVVLRLLDKEMVVLPIDGIGFSQSNFETFQKFIKYSNGIILLTGPTGCGKTTTLYSTLNHITRPELNIITVEDPVEYRLDGINQVQVNPRIKFSFANALRTILRQDPDIVMVGEMRDLETAEIGTRAALTGHLVFSTLHTNNASQAITRLVDMGVPAFLVASSLIGAVAQRLVRRICANCRQEYAPTSEEQNFYENVLKKTPPVKLYKGEGCKRCNKGYRGRTAIHEIQPITNEMRTMIIEGTTPANLQKKAQQMGMHSLLEDGIMKAEQGVTTFDEVMRVAFSDF